LFDTVWPVKTWVVEVPTLSVTVKVAVNGPAVAYVWVVVGLEVLTLVPSPNVQA
jgi:hypothetical protein